MLYREIIAVCSEIHTKHINTMCGQNVGLLNVKPGGTYNNHWALHIIPPFAWRNHGTRRTTVAVIEVLMAECCNVHMWNVKSSDSVG
jgi:hypothetical protein